MIEDLLDITGNKLRVMTKEMVHDADLLLEASKKIKKGKPVQTRIDADREKALANLRQFIDNSDWSDDDEARLMSIWRTLSKKE
jgi:hypothetical protein